MSSAQPSFSIVVPTRGRPAPLRSCLAALSGLDYPGDRFEVIVVDDGGRDRLEGVREEFSGGLDITLHRQPPAGPAAARNAGARLATRDVLAFTDDDCVAAVDWLQALARRFASGAVVAVAGRVVNACPESRYSEATTALIDFLAARLNADAGRAWFATTNNLAVPAGGGGRPADSIQRSRSRRERTGISATGGAAWATGSSGRPRRPSRTTGASTWAAFSANTSPMAGVRIASGSRRRPAAGVGWRSSRWRSTVPCCGIHGVAIPCGARPGCRACCPSRRWPRPSASAGRPGWRGARAPVVYPETGPACLAPPVLQRLVVFW